MMIQIPRPVLLAILLPTVATQAQTATACIKGGGYEFTFDGACDKENFIAAFEDTIFDDPLLKSAGCTNSVEEELAALLGDADLDAGIKATCKAAQDAKHVITLDRVPNDVGGTFVSDYYNGGTRWNTETETLQYPSDGTTPEQVLKRYAADVDSYYDHARREPFVWPNELPQFNLDECELKSAQCCWPQDRQANDNNGNCAKPYDTNCVDKDPGDNTDLCMVDLSYAPANNFVKSTGFTLFPGDNNNGEGPIHCHGFAWGNDDMDVLARYKANNLFYVSMYDHMYQRGYVRNIPGAPMCGCLEKMPIVSRSDCTQTNVKESYKFIKSASTKGFTGKIQYATLEFQACQGANNKNNDLEAYYQRLVNEDRITTSQQEVFKKYIVGNNQCQNTIDAFLEARGYKPGIALDEAGWTYVVGEGDLMQKDNQIYDGLKVTTMFNESPNKIMRRVCTECYNSHKDIFYKRLTPLPENFDILNLMMNDWTNTNNVLNTDFELYSTYIDALSGDTSKRWTFCNFNDLGIGFPRDCGPTGRVNWNWNSYYRGGGRAQHHAFYVEANPEMDYKSLVGTDISAHEDASISQSSTGWGGNADRAKDGNSVGIYGWSTVTHTNWEQAPHWQVFFGSEATVNKVYIWNRIDCCRNRSRDYKIELLEGVNGGTVADTKILSGYLPVMNMVDFEGKAGFTLRITPTFGNYKLLSLAEVQVFGDLDPTKVIKNIAGTGTATQSSTNHGGVASRAIDDDINGHWSGKSVTHTATESSPWWKLNFPEPVKISQVILYNRSDCCWTRLNRPIVEVWKDGALVKKVDYPGPSWYVPRYGASSYSLDNVEGDEVRVWINRWGILSLAEVQVYSHVDESVITPSPVAAATAVPSSSPSAGPSAKASDAPSKAPTGSPVVAASDAPSKAPTGSPVATPVAEASEVPSKAPTGSPVATPVAEASEVPSKAPTGSPVTTPVAEASDAPSKAPTGSPVTTPVAEASEVPSASPSVGTTSAPTTVANVVVSKLDNYEEVSDEELNNLVTDLIELLKEKSLEDKA